MGERIKKLLGCFRLLHAALINIAEISEEIKSLSKTCDRLEHDIIRLDASLEELSRVFVQDRIL